MNYILDSNGTAIYNGDRIKIIDANNVEFIGTLIYSRKDYYFKPDTYSKKYRLFRFEKYYKLFERKVLA